MTDETGAGHDDQSHARPSARRRKRGQPPDRFALQLGAIHPGHALSLHIGRLSGVLRRMLGPEWKSRKYDTRGARKVWR